MRLAFKYACLILALSAAGQAHAQSNEDRLRDALRQSVAEMRAAQDQAAQAQADLQKAQQDRAAMQAQLDAANAKLAQAKPAAPPADLARPERRTRREQTTIGSPAGIAGEIPERLSGPCRPGAGARRTRPNREPRAEKPDPRRWQPARPRISSSRMSRRIFFTST